MKSIQQLIGDKAFYRRMLAVVLPLIIQNSITNFVSLLDNIMVGQVGTVQMSGVAIVNQLMFVFYLSIFGATSGAGIFTAQFFGSQDHKGIRHTFRFKLLISLVITVAALGIFKFGGSGLIQLYLRGDGSVENAELSLAYGLAYLAIMLLGLPAVALGTVYSSTIRECGEAKLPMIASTCAVFVNLALNYVLIFGHLGFAPMGVQGAAIATVVSRYVELLIIVVWTHRHAAQHPFIVGAYRSMAMPASLFFNIFRKSLPLLINEFLWSSGMATINQCYSTKGLDVVAALNISSTMYNLASVVFLAMGNAVGIIIGQMLGAGRPEEEVRDADRKLIATSIASCMVFAGLMGAASGLFPQLYNTTEDVRHLSTWLICISAVMMPFNAYTNAAYFTLRSGGQTLVTFLFDSCFVWTVCVPLAFCLSRFTNLGILPIYAICQGTDLLKCAIGAYMIKKGAWIQTLVQNHA